MGKEAQAYHFIRNSLLILLIGGVPLLDLGNTTRVLKALDGKKVDCSYGEAANQFYSFDLIAIYSGGTYLGEDGEHPNTFQSGRLDAAAAAFTEGLAPKIVLLDGGPDDVVQESIRYLRAKVDEFSNGTIYLKKGSVEMVPGSVNTASNAKDLGEYMRAHGDKKALGITDDFHARRTSLLNCNYGVNSQVMTVEEFAPEHYPYNIPAIDLRNNSLEMQLTRIGEEFKTGALIWDPFASLSTEIKSAMIDAGDR